MSSCDTRQRIIRTRLDKDITTITIVAIIIIIVIIIAASGRSIATQTVVAPFSDFL